MEDFGFDGPDRPGPDDNGPEQKSDQHTSSVTRRGFIVGAASSVAVARSASAQAGLVEFSIQDGASAITVVFRNQLCAAPLTFSIVKDYWSKYPAGVKSPQFLMTDVASPALPDSSNRRIATVDIRG